MTGRSRLLAWARVAGAVAILGVVVLRLGAGPFLDGLRRVDAATLGLALLLGLAATACAAWRWLVVARALGLAVAPGAALARCYRAQLLNAALPGGVLGDVHRGISHGRESGDVARGLRAVVLERVTGQALALAATGAALLVLPSSLGAAVPLGLLALVAAGAVVLVGARMVPVAAWPALVASSLLALVPLVAMLLVAAHVAGTSASVARLVPLALVGLAAMALPLSIAGFGPREGALAWAFGSAGLGASLGVSTATVYGVMSLVGSAPGAAVLLAGALRGRGAVAAGDGAGG